MFSMSIHFIFSKHLHNLPLSLSSKDRFFKVFAMIYDNLEFIESILIDFLKTFRFQLISSFVIVVHVMRLCVFFT